MSAKQPKVKAVEFAKVEPANETHMQLFHRLASVVNMHGTPGAKKARGGGK